MNASLTNSMSQLPKDELTVGFFRSIHTYTFLMRHCLCSLEMEREGEGRGECHLSHWIVTINNNFYLQKSMRGGGEENIPITEMAERCH